MSDRIDCTYEYDRHVRSAAFHGVPRIGDRIHFTKGTGGSRTVIHLCVQRVVWMLYDDGASRPWLYCRKLGKAVKRAR